MAHSIPKKCAIVLLALLTSMSLAVSVSEDSVGSISFLEMFQEEVDGLGLAYLVVAVAISVLYLKFWDRFVSSCKWITHLLAALLSAFMLIGISYTALDSWDFIFASAQDFAFALVVFAGYFVLFDICLSCLYSYLESDDSFFTRLEEKRFPEWIEKHYFLFALLVICACWLPFWILNLPGSVPFDGYYQLVMGTGNDGLTHHHPWLLSLLYGLIMGIGQNVSDNFGVFLVVLFGFATEALCYSGVCCKIRSWGANRTVNILVLAFFAILPCFGTYAQDVWKDGLFAAFLALFFVLYVDLILDMRRSKKVEHAVHKFVVLFLVEMLVCLTRNNGIYMMVAGDALLLFFLNRDVWKCCFGIVALTLGVGIGYWAVEGPIADAAGVVEEDGAVKEVISVPMQQTARYLVEYPDDVTEEEAEAIDGILRYDKIAEHYDPLDADRVKDYFRTDLTDEDLETYFEDAWLPMFQQHPLVYVQAFINGAFGYFYPFSCSSELNGFTFYIKGNSQEEVFDLNYVFPAEVRLVTKRYTNAWESLPGLSQLVNPGTYTWILLIMGGYLCYEKRFRKLLALAVPFLNVCVCMVSPVNGYLRYALPLIACTPALVYWCASKVGLSSERCRKRQVPDSAGDGEQRVRTGTKADVQAPASGGDDLTTARDGGRQAAGYSRNLASGYGGASGPVSGYGIRRPVSSCDGDRTLAFDCSDLASAYSGNQIPSCGMGWAPARGGDAATSASDGQGGRYPAESAEEQVRYCGKHVRSSGAQGARAPEGCVGSATGETSS